MSNIAERQAVRYPTGWKRTEAGLFEKRLSETEMIMLSQDDLTAWEKSHHGEIRGMKQNARCDAAYESVTGGAVSPAAPAPVTKIIDLMMLKERLAKGKDLAPPMVSSPMIGEGIARSLEQSDPSSLADDSAAAEADYVEARSGMDGREIADLLTGADPAPSPSIDTPTPDFGGGGGFDGAGAGGSF